MVQTKHYEPDSLRHTRSGKAKTRVTKTNETTGKITTYINDFLDIEDGEEKLFFYSGDLKLATLETENTPIGITTCAIPQTGDWIITQNCTIGTFETAPENITITAGTLLTITNTGTLEIDLNTNSLTIEESGGILIKTGGNLTQTGKLTPPQNEEESEKKLIYHHTDHLSGASVDTNENGDILQLTDYYPYGDERIEDTLTDFHNDYTYTGKERDEDTKLLYYEARYYNSHIGRFISIDPWSGDITDPQSLNKYAYVRNNPLKYMDPDGKETVSAEGIACLLVCVGGAVHRDTESGDISYSITFGGGVSAYAEGGISVSTSNPPENGYSANGFIGVEGEAAVKFGSGVNVGVASSNEINVSVEGSYLGVGSEVSSSGVTTSYNLGMGASGPRGTVSYTFGNEISQKPYGPVQLPTYGPIQRPAYGPIQQSANDFIGIQNTSLQNRHQNYTGKYITGNGDKIDTNNLTKKDRSKIKHDALKKNKGHKNKKN